MLARNLAVKPNTKHLKHDLDDFGTGCIISRNTVVVVMIKAFGWCPAAHLYENINALMGTNKGVNSTLTTDSRVLELEVGGLYFMQSKNYVCYVTEISPWTITIIIIMKKHIVMSLELQTPDKSLHPSYLSKSKNYFYFFPGYASFPWTVSKN